MEPSNKLYNVCIYFSVNEDFDDNFKDRTVDIHYSGYMFWIFGGTISVLCELEIEMFPYDTQICSIDVGSWMFSTRSLNIIPDFAGKISKAAEHPTWRLKNRRVTKVDHIYISLHRAGE